jgi:hypothetical protein
VDPDIFDGITLFHRNKRFFVAYDKLFFEKSLQTHFCQFGFCRQNLVGSLSRCMPKVVDCRQTGVQATNEMVMQNNTRVYLGSGCRVGVIPYILLYFVIAVWNNVLQARLP